MKNHFCRQQFALSFLTFIFLLVSGNLISFAQESKLLSEVEIRILMNTSFNKDNKSAEIAKAKLEKLDVHYIPVLKEILEKGGLCEQFQSAQLIIDLTKKDNKAILPQLINASQRYPLDSLSDSDEWICRRGIAFLLPYSAPGIRALTKLLTHKSLYLRQNAIFGFDDLTEVKDYKNDSLKAIKEAVPVIAKAIQDDDEIVSEMSDEVLTQIGDDPRTEDLVEAERKKQPK